jgi:transposase
MKWLPGIPLTASSWSWTARAGINPKPFKSRPIFAYFRFPPYSPELNPVENIWDDLQEKDFSNRFFQSIDSLENHLESSLRNMENNKNRVHSIVAWPWIINSLLN